MSRPRVVLVDPSDTRREVFAAYLSTQFDVYPFALAAKAIKRFDGVMPDVVLAHVRQPGTSGLDLSKQIRERPHGPKVLVVVYGNPVGPRPSAGKVEKIRQQCGIDVYMAREVDEVDLEKVIGVQLAEPAETRTVPDGTTAQHVKFISAARQQPTDEEGEWSGAVPVLDRKGYIRAMQEEYGGLVDELPEAQEVSWGELLRARANLHNLRVMLDKPVTPLIDELPTDRRPTLSEVLRAKVTLQNLRVILSPAAQGNESTADAPTAE